ncbi:general transcription factor II-I repeat domain-containing protein 2-like [Watersipora subatra]|uniref:general transcription factor II-I repeat domain-containing protein 2-like n=1 Tax=Watersipora subatra TaxID=2589382 RepID=UPI00355C45EB
MSSVSKKRKLADEKRVFQVRWEDLYFVTEVSDKIHCLVCQQTIAVPKEFNVRRHYETMHRVKYDAYTGKVRQDKVIQLKSALCKQRSFFTKINQSNKDSVRVSFVLSEMIAKSSRPFTEGSFIKECLLTASDILCPNQKKLFEGISLSANTVASRITDLAANVEMQLTETAMDFEAFSIALDESTDASDIAQCAVFIRGVDRNLNVTEEFLELLPLKGTTTGRDLFQALEKCIEKYNLPWDKLVSLATDGAPSMCSQNVGVVGLVKNKLNSLETAGINFTSIHCILHQEALCSKSLQMKEVMDVVVKTVNYIRSRGLNHRQFTSFLADMESEYGELIYHTEVRWLSRGKVLRRFFALRHEIASFMTMKNKAVPLLTDSTFQCNLAFLTDITDHLNTLNIKLQGKQQIITQMYDSVKSFRVKLRLWMKQLGEGNLAHFSTLNSLGNVETKCLKEYADLMSELLQQFDVRFADFKLLEPQFQLFSTPFAVEIDAIAEELQMELVELQCDTILKQKYAEVGIPEFYTFLSRERFPRLLSATARILPMFGSTFACEQFFSSMKVNKSVLRSQLTNEHLQATLRLVSSHKIKPNIDALVDAKRCQVSSQYRK